MSAAPAHCEACALAVCTRRAHAEMEASKRGEPIDASMQRLFDLVTALGERIRRDGPPISKQELRDAVIGLDDLQLIAGGIVDFIPSAPDEGKHQWRGILTRANHYWTTALRAKHPAGVVIVPLAEWHTDGLLGSHEVAVLTYATGGKLKVRAYGRKRRRTLWSSADKPLASGLERRRKDTLRLTLEYRPHVWEDDGLEGEW